MPNKKFNSQLNSSTIPALAKEIIGCYNQSNLKTKMPDVEDNVRNLNSMVQKNPSDGNLVTDDDSVDCDKKSRIDDPIDKMKNVCSEIIKTVEDYENEQVSDKVEDK